jgi:uncharacterized membrane protein
MFEFFCFVAVFIVFLVAFSKIRELRARLGKIEDHHQSLTEYLERLRQNIGGVPAEKARDQTTPPEEEAQPGGDPIQKAAPGPAAVPPPLPPSTLSPILSRAKEQARIPEERSIPGVAAASQTDDVTAADDKPGIAGRDPAPASAAGAQGPAPAQESPETIPEGEGEGQPPKPAVNWELFMGARLFAWLGGLALFIGVCLFVKFAFEQNWISPAMRVALGYLAGLGTLVTGLRLDRGRFAVTSHTLIATGILIFYGTTYACKAVYDFPLFEGPFTTLCFVLITGLAITLADRFNALAVAVLGLVGGFLTPILLPDQETTFLLFSYVALLNVGILVLAARRHWHFLPLLASIGTLLLQLRWLGLHSGEHSPWIAVAVLLVFPLLQIVALGYRQRRNAEGLDWWASSAGVLLVGGFMFSVSCLDQPAIFLTLVLSGAVLCQVISLLVPGRSYYQRIGNLVSFGLLALWVSLRATPELLPATLAATCCYALLSAGNYVLMSRKADQPAPSEAGLLTLLLPFGLFVFPLFGLPQVPWPMWLCLFGLSGGLLLMATRYRSPLLALGATGSTFVVLLLWFFKGPVNIESTLAATLGYALLSVGGYGLVARSKGGDMSRAFLLTPLLSFLLLGPALFNLPQIHPLMWLCLLGLSLGLLVLALRGHSPLLALGALASTFVILLIWFVDHALVEPGASEISFMLVVILVFAISMAVAPVLLMRGRGFANGEESGEISEWEKPFLALEKQIPALSLGLPFLLLLLLTTSGALPNPGGLFGTALALSGMLVLLGAMMRQGVLPLVALGASTVVLLSWQEQNLNLEQASAYAGGILWWHLAFFLFFLVTPSVTRGRHRESLLPWISSALAGPIQFFGLYRCVQTFWPDLPMGIVPGVLAGAYGLALLYHVFLADHEGDRRRDVLAWFSGSFLFFVILVIPIQLEREWITIGWAVQGLALVWLYRRLSHPGLRGIGLALLLVAFVRAALNPAVLSYYPRAEFPILNWYLYTYGVVAVSLLLAAWKLQPGDLRLDRLRIRPWLSGMGLVLLFFLLNLEIADFFTEPGQSTLVFDFQGNRGRDMTYTIGWSLFAFALLLPGLWKNVRVLRYAGLGLLGLAFAKLFLHDLATLPNLYRIAAFLITAVIAILVSFLYQRNQAEQKEGD